MTKLSLRMMDTWDNCQLAATQWILVGIKIMHRECGLESGAHVWQVAELISSSRAQVVCRTLGTVVLRKIISPPVFRPVSWYKHVVMLVSGQKNWANLDNAVITLASQMVLWPKGICELQQIMTTYGFSRDLMPQRRKIDTPNSEVDTNTCISIVLIWVRCERLVAVVAMFCVMGVTIRDQETTCHVTLLFTFSSREISPRYYGLVTKLFHWCH